MPLYEKGLTSHRAMEQQRLEESYRERGRQALSELSRDWHKAHDHLESLGEQRDINAQAASESVELAAIVYSSYRTGALTYTEVQNANFRALEAKINLTKTQVQILRTLAILASIAQDPAAGTKE